MPVTIASLAVHPVKSTAIRHVTQAHVGPAGLVGDREWMVVDGDGELVSAREERALFTVVADTAATGQNDADLRLSAPGHPDLEVARPIEGSRDVQMFRSKHLQGRPAGGEADAWLRAVLGRDDVSLVWCHAPESRRLSVGRESDHAAFQDGYPVTLLSEASVRQVHDWTVDAAIERGEEPPTITADRFRPNIVLRGCEPFEEDDWERVRIGEVTLRRAKLVGRCVMTTIDPSDLSGGKDPLRALVRHRRWDGSTWCAVHHIPESTGVIAVGDEVEVL
ncbi:MAG: MOSC domain-containing protein [Mobilicoccus sp.]|nr:MOSC domain-containing protein [Mobilicoccus sp.]